MPPGVPKEAAAAMDDLDLLVNASQAGEAPRIVDMTKWSLLERPAFAASLSPAAGRRTNLYQSTNRGLNDRDSAHIVLADAR